MTKPSSGKIAKANAFSTRLSQDAELSALQSMAAHILKHPAEGRALLIRAGIYTKGGKLTKAYGG